MSSHDQAQQNYEENVRRLQAQAMADLEKDLAKAKRLNDPLRNERRLLVSQLAAARRKKGFTQRQLAAKLGLKQSALSRLENGKGNPGLNTLLKIARALGVHLVVE